MARTTQLEEVYYVSEGRIVLGNITIEDGVITRLDNLNTLMSAQFMDSQFLWTISQRFVLPGIIDDHVHTREPGLTHKGDLSTETHAAAAGGVTSIMDMPNVVPQTTTLEALAERQQLGRQHSFVNYAFHFGATADNADLLPELDPRYVPAVKLFMGSSTGNMLVDGGDALERIFERSPLPIMLHCEDQAIIAENLLRAKELYGDDPDVRHHPEIRSREACLASFKKALQLALKYNKHIHLAHVTTKEEMEWLPHFVEDAPDTLWTSPDLQMPPDEFWDDNIHVTSEVCVSHLLFCDEDYATLGTRIKCNPAIKTREDRDALRRGLRRCYFSVIATDHAPHLLTEKEGGCCRAASGMPMVQFALPAMMELVEQNVISLPELVQLMCHNPARLFGISDRGSIQEGMRADLVVIHREPWTLTADKVVSRCGWSPLEGRTLNWQVEQTYCNGRLIYNKGVFAEGNDHAEPLVFDR